MNTPSAEPRPTLISPVDDTLTDSLATLFEWEGVPLASGYRIEVAEDPDFERVAVAADVQNSTSLTLYDALPLDGSSLWWRVTAHVRDRLVQSAATSFRAAVDFTEQSVPSSAAVSVSSNQGGVQTAQGVATMTGPIDERSNVALMVSIWVILTLVLTIIVFMRIL